MTQSVVLAVNTSRREHAGVLLDDRRCRGGRSRVEPAVHRGPPNAGKSAKRERYRPRLGFYSATSSPFMNGWMVQ